MVSLKSDDNSGYITRQSVRNVSAKKYIFFPKIELFMRQYGKMW